MEPFPANDISQPKEQISSYFFQYGAPNHINDVAIEEIIAPNNDSRFNRFNPLGFNPIIKVRNLGSEDLKTLTITYQTVGFKAKKYQWNGNLGFYETALITLPGEIFTNPGTNNYSVSLSGPNGVEDEWDGDNSLETEFSDIPTIPSEFVVDFLTNNRPKENSIFIVNSKNDTVYSKLPEMLEPATEYSNTLNLGSSPALSTEYWDS